MGALKIEDLPHYTYLDYIQWEGNWELINGVPYAMSPAPMKRHQSLANRIGAILDEQLEECEACYASQPVDWKIGKDTVLQPDNLVICENDEGMYTTKTPPIIFEILSPSTSKKDMGIKFEIYQREGVRWYIIVDPNENMAKVYENLEGRFVKRVDATKEKVKMEFGECTIEFDFARLWR
jgi:Uma2 family endonuclease